MLTGGGNGVHTYGSVMMTGNLTLGGNADHYYSSAALDAIEADIGSGQGSSSSYQSVYFGEGYQTIVQVEEQDD